jgi:hypothetical protein
VHLPPTWIGRPHSGICNATSKAKPSHATLAGCGSHKTLMDLGRGASSLYSCLKANASEASLTVRVWSSSKHACFSLKNCFHWSSPAIVSLASTETDQLQLHAPLHAGRECMPCLASMPLATQCCCCKTLKHQSTLRTIGSHRSVFARASCPR